MRGDVHSMTVMITRSTHGHRNFLPKGQRTFLLMDIHPVLFGMVYPDLDMAGFELVESHRLDPDEADALRRAYKTLGKAGDIVRLTDVHDDLKAVIERMEDENHADLDAYRRRLEAVLEYFDDCMIVRPGEEED